MSRGGCWVEQCRCCPYAMRARMAIAVAGIEVETREVALRNKPDAMMAASPKGTVPILVLPGGGVIEESLDIMNWALREHDPGGWLSGRDTALITANDGVFKYHLDRMKYPHRFEQSDPAYHYQQGVGALMLVEAALGPHRFLGGDCPRYTDIALFPFVRQFARADLTAWQQAPVPRVRDWLDALTGLALFNTVMVRRPLWTETDAVAKEGA